jgi:hypothetical protein
MKFSGVENLHSREFFNELRTTTVTADLGVDAKATLYRDKVTIL